MECLFGMKPRDGGAVKARVLVIPFEKISCLVPLRTGMLREPDHRTLCAHHSLPFGWGTVTRPTRTVPLLFGMEVDECREVWAHVWDGSG